MCWGGVITGEKLDGAEGMRGVGVSWINRGVDGAEGVRGVVGFDEPCSSMLHPLNFVTVVLLVWVPNSGAILHKRANQRKALFSGQPFKLRHKNESLKLALFVMVAMCFDHSKSLLRVTPKYLASMTSSSTCPVSSQANLDLFAVQFGLLYFYYFC